MELENLEQALDRQLDNFDRNPLVGKVRYGTKIYPKLVLKDSILEMNRIVRETRACLAGTLDKQSCWNSFNSQVNSRFDIFVPVPGRDEPGYGSTLTTKFTAYYSPEMSGSRTPSERFRNPIYMLPPSEDLRKLSREDIDFDKRLENKGLELFWLEDSLFDIYVLHVEGGGRVKLFREDGMEEKVFISYAGANGQSGQFISRYMVSQGYVRQGASMNEQAKFIDENPQLQREIFSTYRPYVYFRETSEEPHGVQNISLTEGRSLAIDTRIYKDIGVITFVSADKAVLRDDGTSEQVPFSRFFVSQDTGGAIRGNARCDLYMGFGKQAAHAAQNMTTQGRQYFLIKKQ